MVGLRFIVLAGASLFSVRVGATSADEAVGTENQEGTLHTAERVDCLPAMNAARKEASLPHFAAPTNEEGKLPIVEKTNAGSSAGGTTRNSPTEVPKDTSTEAEKKQARFLNAFCEALLKEGDASSDQQNYTNGTYMYAPANSTLVEECNAAVGYWKSAITSFTTLPPPYTQGKEPYDKHKNISFVGLFNTENNSTLDCAAITCNPKRTAGSQPDRDAMKEENQKPTSYSLLCLTNPPALQGSKEPFTQAQWDKIAGRESSSAQSRVVGTLALAGAVLVHSLF